MEEWKPISLIPGFEAYTNYEMKIDGTIRRTTSSARAESGHVLTWRTMKTGYLDCQVSCNDKRKRILQHRAIAYLFIDKPDDCHMVDHINGQRNDNRIDNLRWCTTADNCHNSSKYQTKEGYKHISKICSRNHYWYWRVQIHISGRYISRQFSCSSEATEPPAEVIACRDQMVKELHGEFAVQR